MLLVRPLRIVNSDLLTQHKQAIRGCARGERGRHLDMRLVEEAAHAVGGVVAGGAPRVQQRAHATGLRHEVQQSLPLALGVRPAACGSAMWAQNPNMKLGQVIKIGYRPRLTSCEDKDSYGRARTHTIVDVLSDAPGTRLRLGALLQVEEAHVVHGAAVLQDLHTSHIP